MKYCLKLLILNNIFRIFLVSIRFRILISNFLKRVIFKTSSNKVFSCVILTKGAVNKNIMRSSNLKKILLFLGIIGSILMVHQSTAHAQKIQNNDFQSTNNLVENGDFETGQTSPWEYVNGTGFFSVKKHNGSLQGELYSGGQIQQEVKILDDSQKYYFSMDYDQVYSGYQTRVTLTAYDGEGRWLGQLYSGSSYSEIPGSFESDALTVLKGTDHIVIDIFGAIKGDLYVDNVVLKTCQS